MDIFYFITVLLFFGIAFLIIKIYGKLKKRCIIKKLSTSVPVGSSVENLRQFMAETVPVLLTDYNVLQPVYFTRFSYKYLLDGSVEKITEDDLVPGVSMSDASWALQHCLQLATARMYASNTVLSAKSSGVKYIDVQVFRPNPDCSLVPQNKKYKVGSKIPVYPCADCHEDFICQFFYKTEF